MQALSLCIQYQGQQTSAQQLQTLSLTCKVLRSQLETPDCQTSASIKAQRPLRRGRPQLGLSQALVQSPPQIDAALEKPKAYYQQELQQALDALDWTKGLQVFRQNREDALLNVKPSDLQTLVQGLTIQAGKPFAESLSLWPYAIALTSAAAGLSTKLFITDAIELVEACKAAGLTFSRRTYTGLVSAAVQVRLAFFAQQHRLRVILQLVTLICKS